jgi:hypothetical protein
MLCLMKTTASKKISGAAYVGIQADLASREGPVSPRLANLYFQCACVEGQRTFEEWEELVVKAMGAEVSVQEALEYDEDDKG